jgi:hypothetical protein
MSGVDIAPMDVSPVDQATAAAMEAAEARAWQDMYAAAPAHFAEAAGLRVDGIGEALVLRWAATGRRYFSRVIGIGVTGPATPDALDSILDLYAQAGVTQFLLQSLPHCRPSEYETWLRERGLEPFDAQDRVARDGRALTELPPGAPGRDLGVERVDRRGADEWQEFLQRVYRLDTGPWLGQLVDRPGWHQYVAREAGEVVAARGMYVGSDGIAWLGMDGPVPGLGTQDYEPDAAICAHIVRDGLARGARGFIADIEAPSAVMDTPAYRYFGELGFRRPYVRTHWARL